MALKITGRMTFAMTAQLKDRMTNIVAHMNSEDSTTAMVWDLSAVPELDYTCLLAIRDILTAARPGVRSPVDVGVRSTLRCKGVAVYVKKNTHTVTHRKKVPTVSRAREFTAIGHAHSCT